MMVLEEEVVSSERGIPAGPAGLQKDGRCSRLQWKPAAALSGVLCARVVVVVREGEVCTAPLQGLLESRDTHRP